MGRLGPPTPNHGDESVRRIEDTSGRGNCSLNPNGTAALHHLPRCALAQTGARTCFWYHRSAVGHAIGQDVTTDITWHGDRAAHFVANWMSQGSVLIDGAGVVAMVCQES